MNFTNRIAKTLTIMFVGLFTCSLAFAQQQQMPPQQQQPPTDVSDDEIQLFVEASKEVSKIQQENEADMINAIEEEDLNVEQFNEIMSAQQGQEVENEASAEDMAAFNNAAQKIMKIQEDMQVDIEQVLNDQGMDPERYQAIMMAYQQDPELQQKINTMMQEDQQ